jgi:hypothetical protein
MAGVCFLPPDHLGPGVRLQKGPASGGPET